MLVQQVPDGPLKPDRMKFFGHLQQHGLIIVVMLGQVLGKEPALDGSKWNRTRDQGLFSVWCLARHNHTSQLGDSLILEELPGSQMKPSLLRLHNHLDTQDRVATQ